MEKRKPTYDLAAIQSAFATVDGLRATSRALRDAAALGFEAQGIVDTVQSMRRDHFFKSMTSYADHRVWQDVYYVPSEVGTLYVKFTADALTEFVLLSFKEKSDG